MRWSILFALMLFVAAPDAVAGENASILKVLPQLLDLKGRHTLSPSLYERDAYQARLLKRPQERGGLRWAVQWRVRNRPSAVLKVKIEARSAEAGKPSTSSAFEKVLDWKNRRSQWAEIALKGETYTAFGELTAWRVTLWDGDQKLAESTSFLW